MMGAGEIRKTEKSSSIRDKVVKKKIQGKKRDLGYKSTAVHRTKGNSWTGLLRGKKEILNFITRPFFILYS